MRYIDAAVYYYGGGEPHVNYFSHIFLTGPAWNLYTWFQEVHDVTAVGRRTRWAGRAEARAGARAGARERAGCNMLIMLGIYTNRALASDTPALNSIPYNVSPHGRDRSCSGNAARRRRITTRERASCTMTDNVSFPVFSEHIKISYLSPFRLLSSPAANGRARFDKNSKNDTLYGTGRLNDAIPAKSYIGTGYNGLPDGIRPGG
jgi:hypothetical protein